MLGRHLGHFGPFIGFDPTELVMYIGLLQKHAAADPDSSSDD
jgi:hypothetical protein